LNSHLIFLYTLLQIAKRSQSITENYKAIMKQLSESILKIKNASIWASILALNFMVSACAPSPEELKKAAKEAINEEKQAFMDMVIEFLILGAIGLVVLLVIYVIFKIIKAKLTHDS
jgi:hypothetical protein